MTQEEIIEALENEREQFMELIDDLDDEVLEQSEIMPGWTIKDILAHLTMWEAELVKLLWQAKQGQKPTTAHFQPLTVDEVNSRWLAVMRERPLEMVMTDFESVRKQTLRRLESFSDKELSDPKRYSWARGEPLGQWIANDSFEHEAEHREQIDNWRRRQEGKEPPGE